MAQYLLAAEADKIQDLLFRSARLREVVGGSQLLTRFCWEVPQHLGVSPNDIIVSDGGGFRILFDTEKDALAFGDKLAEVYRRATGGTLSIAEPVPVNGNFGAISEQAEENLRRAKRWHKGWQEQPHLPYMAFCVSCGIGIAVAYRAYHEGEEAQYLCESCLNKGLERPIGKLGKFLEDFFAEVVGVDGLKQADWPGRQKRRGRDEIDPLEDVADYDPRRYVAYLLADGNDMGKAFSSCQTPEQMRALSTGLSKVVYKALAEPTQTIMQKNPLDDRPDFIPVLPLIMGGDDLFALIPASWAIDFAQRFCQAYEQGMRELFDEIELQDVPAPTVSATVVICKSKHPYRLAHEAGEIRLKEAKRVGKRLILDEQQPGSTVNFEVVLGGRLVIESSTGTMRPTLRPYWVDDSIPQGWGLPVKRLIEQRYELRDIPNKRLSELRDLYDDPPASSKKEDLDTWQARLNRLRTRIGRKEAHKAALDTVLAELGGGDSSWYRVDRHPEDAWHGHGLPDLLEVWNFALCLDKGRQEYEEEAE